MSSNFHTPHVFGAPLSSSEINTPLAALDAQVTRLTARSFNVLDYGAVRNGVTDDKAAIQAALNAAHAVGGGEVLLPPGVYYVASPLTVYSGTHLVGSGPAGQQFVVGNYGTILQGNLDTKIIVTEGTDVTGTGVEGDPYVSDRKEKYSFRGIHFKNGDAASTDADNVLVDLRYAYQVVVEDCVFNGNSRAGTIGLRLYNSGHVTVRNCVFQGFPGYGTYGGVFDETKTRPALEICPTPSLFPGGFPVQMFDLNNLVFAYCERGIDIANRDDPTNDGIHTVKIDGLFMKRSSEAVFNADDASTGVTCNTTVDALTISNCKFEDQRAPLYIRANSGRVSTVFINHATIGVVVAYSNDVTIDGLTISSTANNVVGTGVQLSSTNTGPVALLRHSLTGSEAASTTMLDNNAGLLGAPLGLVPITGANVSGGAAVSVAERMIVVPCQASQSMTLTGVQLYCNTNGNAGAKFYVALYDAAGDQLAISAETANEAAYGTGRHTVPFTSSVTIGPGFYWLALASNENVATFGITGSSGTVSLGLSQYQDAPDAYPPPATLSLDGATSVTPALVALAE